MKKVLLVQPPFHGFYDQAKVKVALPERHSLTFATLAAPLLLHGHEVSILDLNQENQPKKALEASLQDFKPDLVGITCTTPLYFEAKDIAATVKEYNRETKVVVGGVHPSSFPQETLADTQADFGCVGEGDYVLLDIVEGQAPEAISSLWYRQDGHMASGPAKQFIKDMDALPYPAWHLLDLKKYHTPRLTARKNPVGPMETSRGCVFGCTYCNKNIFGRTFRAKSPQRVVAEMEHMLEIGFKEIVVMDDGFTTNMARAKEICRLIVEKGLKFPWNLQNGI
ncbi:MAG: radical SAM protein, partial [Chloroflexota bacterium]